jgi:hypothetical protein
MASTASVDLIVACVQGFGAIWKTGANASDDFVPGVEPSDAIVGFIYFCASAGSPLRRRRPDPGEFNTLWKG